MTLTPDASASALMARAVRLARRGWYTARPNPRVGCVLTREGVIVGEGWHEAAGQPHAEVNAIAAAAGRAAGATAFVTLEPCAHHGRTPPCSDALIEASVAAVFVAVRDPFPEVGGRGIAALREAGIDVHEGLLEAAARQLNEGYLSRVERGRPFVRVKVATSLDGATAMASGESQWITGMAAREDVQRLRAEAGAILTGVDTVIADNPSLTCRSERFRPLAQPLRVILDSTLRTPPNARLLGLDGEVLIFTRSSAQAGCSKSESLQAAGAEIAAVAGGDSGVDLTAMLVELGTRGVNDVLVEAGPTLSGALLDADLVDELVIYQAPHIMGSNVRQMFATPSWNALSERRHFRLVDQRAIGEDLRLTLRPTS